MKPVLRALVLAFAGVAAACTVQNPPPAVTTEPASFPKTTATGAAAAPTALATAPAAAPAAAPTRLASQPFVPPHWSVGDTWRYSDGYGMTVVESNGETAKFQRLDDPAQWFVMRGLFREETKSRAALRNVVFRSENPMELFGAPAGKPIVFMREYTRNGVTVRHRTSWTIEGRETVTVPAGTFDTVVAVMRTRSLTGNWVGYERWWYSPAIKNYVRMEYRYGETPESSRVLVTYSVK